MRLEVLLLGLLAEVCWSARLSVGVRSGGRRGVGRGGGDGGLGRLARSRHKVLLRATAAPRPVRRSVAVDPRAPLVQRFAWQAAAEAAKTSLGIYHLMPVRVVGASRLGHQGLVWRLDIVLAEAACKKYAFDFYYFQRIRACGLARDARFSRCSVLLWQRAWLPDPAERELYRLQHCRPSDAQEALGPPR